MIKEGDWRNMIKYDSALNSFTKAKGGKVSYDAKVVQSSLKAYGMAVGLYQKKRSTSVLTVIYIYQ